MIGPPRGVVAQQSLFGQVPAHVAQEAAVAALVTDDEIRGQRGRASFIHLLRPVGLADDRPVCEIAQRLQA